MSPTRVRAFDGASSTIRALGTSLGGQNSCASSASDLTGGAYREVVRQPRSLLGSLPFLFLGFGGWACPLRQRGFFFAFADEGLAGLDSRSRGVFPHPNITEANRISVVLNGDRAFGRVGRVLGWAIERCIPLELEMIQDQDPVMDRRDVGWGCQLAIFLEAGARPVDVVSVPLAWPTHGIDHRRSLFVDGAGLPIVVGLVLEGIEHLQLVTAHQEDAAVAAALSLTAGRRGGGPFEVQLAIAEFRDGRNSTFAADQMPIFNLPEVGVLPLGQILAIEEDLCIGGWIAIRGPGGHHLGRGPLDSVEVLFSAGGGRGHGQAGDHVESGEDSQTARP
jgi:hypothetical protein